MLGNHPSVKIFSMDYTWLLVAPRSKPRKHLSLHSCSLGVQKNCWWFAEIPDARRHFHRCWNSQGVGHWAFLKYVKYMSNQYTVPKTCKLDKVREGCTSAQKREKVWQCLTNSSQGLNFVNGHLFPKGGMASLNVYVKPFVWYFHARQYQNLDRLIALEFFDRQTWNIERFLWIVRKVPLLD